MQILLSRTQAEGQTEQISKSRNKFLESDSEREVEGTRRSFPPLSLSLSTFQVQKEEEGGRATKDAAWFCLEQCRQGRRRLAKWDGRQAAGLPAGRSMNLLHQTSEPSDSGGGFGIGKQFEDFSDAAQVAALYDMFTVV